MSAFNISEWSDPIWRLCNLYWIKDRQGKIVRFYPNESQWELLNNWWYLNVILKDRQRGFSTLIQLMMLDACLFNPNTEAGVIAQGKTEAKAIFRNKLRFAYDRLPREIRTHVYPLSDSAEELRLSNGSTLSVGTSMRSATLQFLHVSEFGKISVRFPERAREIVTGAFNTVTAGCFIAVESTAEGRDGNFFNMVKYARAQLARGIKLTPLDFRFHFFAWHNGSTNVLPPAGVEITAEMVNYFKKLRDDHGINLTPEQKAWYAKKSSQQGDDMKREYPSYPDEAFEAAVEGAIYGQQMQWLRANGRIRRVAAMPEPVNTFWDLGHNDINSIWFHQSAPMGEHRFIDYYENFNQDLEHYVGEIRSRGYLMGKWFLPHDGRTKTIVGKSPEDRLIELGVPANDIVIVSRCENLNAAIEQTRKMFKYCWFDATKCAAGLTHLDNYQWEWDAGRGCWMNRPLHNPASNAADSYRGFAQVWEQTAVQVRSKFVRRGSPMAR